MAKFALLFLFAALVCAANALQCYKCTSFNHYDKDCEMGEHLDTKKMQCNQDHNMDAVCVKYVLKARNSDQQNITRDCVTYPKGNKPQDCNPTAGFEKVSCDTCNSDLCNGAVAFKFNIFAALAVIVSCFATRMYFS